jgi:hypothetical protein
VGVIGLVAGGALVTAGIVWFVTRTPGKTDPAVTGWLAPSSGGVAVTGRF